MCNMSLTQRVVVSISNQLILAAATGAARERHRAGSVDGCNVVADSLQGSIAEYDDVMPHWSHLKSNIVYPVVHSYIVAMLNKQLYNLI